MRYASVNNPVISAIINATYKFPTQELALKTLQGVKDKFILARGHEELMSAGKVKLWIRGYQLQSSEIEQGGLGNFAVIFITAQKDGSYIIECEKEVVDPSLHPMKKRKTARMPNWAHPALKSIKADGKYEKYEDAVEALYNLHQEFPETTIPNKDRLDLQIYSRDGKNKPEMKKYRLNLKPVENYFIIEVEEKTAAKKSLAKPPSNQSQEIIGKFTARALMKKKKRKP